MFDERICYACGRGLIDKHALRCSACGFVPANSGYEDLNIARYAELRKDFMAAALTGMLSFGMAGDYEEVAAPASRLADAMIDEFTREARERLEQED